MIGIYKITNPKGKIYIGQSKDVEYRFSDYKRLRCKNQPKIYNSLVKYGTEKHVFEIILECELSELNDKERYYQELFNCVNNGLNMSLVDCSTSRKEMSFDTKQKMRLIKLGKKLSIEHKNKISTGNLGKTISDETKLKMSMSKKGIKQSKEHIEKLSKIKTGKTHSNETKNKRSLALKGRIIPKETRLKISKSKIGYKQSEKHKENFRLANVNTLLNIQTGIFYFGTKEAAESINMNLSTFQGNFKKNRRNNTPFIYV
jgi:group I intron endonuclease